MIEDIINLLQYEYTGKVIKSKMKKYVFLRILFLLGCIDSEII